MEKHTLRVGDEPATGFDPLVAKPYDRAEAERDAARRDSVVGLPVARRSRTGPGLKRLGAATLLLAVPGVGEAFRHVPPEHLFGDTIDCPCGERHACRGAGELWREGCGRWFVQTRGTVLVYREPDGTCPACGDRMVRTGAVMSCEADDCDAFVAVAA